MKVTPHVAQSASGRRLAVPGEMVRGLQKVDQMFVLTMAAYNLTRMRSLAQLRPEAAQ